MYLIIYTERDGLGLCSSSRDNTYSISIYLPLITNKSRDFSNTIWQDTRRCKTEIALSCF